MLFLGPLIFLGVNIKGEAPLFRVNMAGEPPLSRVNMEGGTPPSSGMTDPLPIEFPYE